MRLRNRQLHGAKFRRQHPIGQYIVDFFCLEAHLVVEFDGGWHAEDLRRSRDEHRTVYIQGQGYRVLCFWNNEVTADVTGVLQRIAEPLFFRSLTWRFAPRLLKFARRRLLCSLRARTRSASIPMGRGNHMRCLS